MRITLDVKNKYGEVHFNEHLRVERDFLVMKNLIPVAVLTFNIHTRKIRVFHPYLKKLTLELTTNRNDLKVIL